VRRCATSIDPWDAAQHGATDAPQILRDVGSGPSRVRGVPIRTTLRQIHLQDSDSAVSTPIAAISQNA